MKKTSTWLVWLPITFFLISLVKYLYWLYGAIHKRYGIEEKLNILDFIYDLELLIGAVIVCAFFIKNKKIKWMSVITGILTLIIVFYYSDRFNPY